MVEANAGPQRGKEPKTRLLLTTACGRPHRPAAFCRLATTHKEAGLTKRRGLSSIGSRARLLVAEQRNAPPSGLGLSFWQVKLASQHHLVLAHGQGNQDLTGPP